MVRFRMHEANVQRAVKQARRKLGISILPHELRHGYATHCLERGTNPRAIQQVMGHKSLETTMGYLHSDSLSIRSPLDMMGSRRLVLCSPHPVAGSKTSAPSAMGLGEDQRLRHPGRSPGVGGARSWCKPHL